MKSIKKELVIKVWNSWNAPCFSIYKGNLKNVGEKSHRLAFSILKKMCACFDGSVSAAQFLTSRRFRRHPYQYDLCPSSDICHRWQNDIIDKCQRWQMTDGGNKSDWYGCLRKHLDVRNWSANTEPSEQAQIFFKIENAKQYDFSPTFFRFPLYIENHGAFREFQTFITNSFFIDFIWSKHSSHLFAFVYKWKIKFLEHPTGYDETVTTLHSWSWRNLYRLLRRSKLQSCLKLEK